jgi:hypothetical protein
LQALGVAAIGWNVVTYSNGSATVVLQGTGSTAYAGEACVNPPPSEVAYTSLSDRIREMSGSGFLTGENLQNGFDVRLSNLDDYFNIVAMLRYDASTAPALWTSAPTTAAPTASPNTPAPATPTTLAPSIPVAPTASAPSAPTMLAPSIPVAPTASAPTAPTTLAPSTSAAPTPPTPTIPVEAESPSSAGVLRARTLVLAVSLYLAAML